MKVFKIFLILLCVVSCGSHDDLDEDNGRLAIIQQANMFLSSSMCGQAIDILKPLYNSKYVDTEVRMTLASAYACKANFSFPTIIEKLKNVSNIYATIVLAMYSDGNDLHLESYQQAATYIRETTTVASSIAAANRSADSNVYMIFMQMGALSSVLSVLGVANRTTGAKTVALTTTTPSAAQKCAAQVAFTTINDCLTNVGSFSAFNAMSTQISNICAGGFCDNLDPAACLSNPVYQASGQAILFAIDAQWN